MKKIKLLSLLVFSFLLVACTQQTEIKSVDQENNDNKVKVNKTEEAVDEGVVREEPVREEIKTDIGTPPPPPPVNLPSIE